MRAPLFVVLTVLGGTACAAEDGLPEDEATDVTAQEVALAPLRVFTGGADIALRWEAVDGATRYTVVRDGAAIASVVPQFNSRFLTDGTLYVDKAVVANVTYAYAVQAFDAAGTQLVQTPTVTATQPAANATTPVPTVTIDLRGQTDLAAYAAAGKATIQTWYPKVADRIARPAYAPQSNLKIIMDPTAGGAAYADTNAGAIHFNLAFARGNQNDLGVFVHESSHLIEQYTTFVPGWIVEGLVDWVRNGMYNDNAFEAPAADKTYLNGYGETAYFLDWITRTFNKPSFVHQLNVANHAHHYSDAIFKTATGKTIGQLWTQMTGHQVSSPGAFLGNAHLCVDIPGSNTTNSTRLWMYTCNGTNAQRWVVVHDRANPAVLELRSELDNKCLTFASDLSITIHSCANAANQKWRHNANGTLSNPHSGLCMEVNNGSSAVGTHLRVNRCQGTNPQKWTLPPA